MITLYNLRYQINYEYNYLTKKIFEGINTYNVAKNFLMNSGISWERII
jgi:hypothetical protein